MNDRMTDLWRRAMDGDDAALEQLLLEALHAETTSATGRAVRRLATRACLERARSLRVRAASSAGDDAVRLRRAAVRSFALAIIARHSPALPKRLRARKQAEAASLLDPPPSPPRSVIASHTVTTLDPLTDTINLLFLPPENTFGRPILSYSATATPDGAGTARTETIAPGAAGAIQTGTISLVISPGPYTVKVTATTSEGTSTLSVASNPVTFGITPPPGPVISATVAVNTATATWGPVTGATEYVTTLYTGLGVPVPGFELQSTPLPTRTYIELANGTYRIGVRSIGLGGFGPEAQSGNLTINVTPGSITAFPLLFEPFSSDPLLVFDLPSSINATLVQRRLAGALVTGSKWRYEYLKAQLLRVAQDTAQFEAYIAQLMQLAASKLQTAQLLASPVFQAALTTIENDTQALQDLASSSDVAGIVDRLAEEASTVLLLQSILTFLIEHEPVRFWIDLFGKMIRDVASFDGSLPRTRDFLDTLFAGTGDVATAIKAAALELKGQVTGQVDTLAAPLRSAVKDLIEETSQALDAVFASFDMPLLMRPSGVEGVPDVPNVGPFAEVLNELRTAVESLVQSIRDRIDTTLDGVAGGGTLFRVIVIAYICLPLLAFLVIAAGGGPFSAAALAAIVLLAAQELVHLLARWLTGPLQSQLNDAKATLLATVRELQGVFAKQIQLLDSPENHLELLSGQLLEVKNAIPGVFLNDAAALIGEVRRSLMNTSVELGLAAERALGFENATAFDTIRPDYEARLNAAPQLPGGSDPMRLAGARLIRDINQLEVRRAQLLDGKEMEVTYRLSLFRLLGGIGAPAVGAVSGLTEVLNARQLLLDVLEEDLVDRNFPGLYRALLKEVRVTGVFTPPLAPAAMPPGVPMTITHLGPSRTRIKRNANPFAPPVQIPGCLPEVALDYASAVLEADAMTTLVNNAIERAGDEFVFQVPRGRPFAWFFTRWTLEGERIRPQVRRILAREIAARISERVYDAACGEISTEAIRAAIKKFFDTLVLNPQESVMLPPVVTTGNPPRVLSPTRQQVKDYLRSLSLDTLLADFLRPALVALHDQTMREIQSHIAKWAGARLEEDRDPQIRAMGFATLVQDLPVETAVYNILPDASTLGGALSQPLPSTGGQSPVTAVDTLQYRPFENRGVQGRLLLGIEAGPNATLPADILLDITVRGCYDEDLAAAVRASRSQEKTELNLANGIALASGKTLVDPATVANLLRGTTDVRTIHFSARAHRDKLLRYASAAADAAGTAGRAGGLLFDETFRPLRANQPLTWLTASAPVILNFRFQLSPPASLADLATTIVVTPADLGIPSALQQEGSIVALGIAVIPYHEPPPTFALPDYDFSSLTVAPVLQPLLPASVSGRDLLVMHENPTPVTFDSIWNAGSPSLALNLGTGIIESRVFDVIFSISMRSPVFETRTNTLGV